MRIATLADASAVHTLRWVDHFRGRGHEVRVWSLESGPDALRVERLPRLPVPSFVRYPLAVGALRRGLAAFRPQLIDAHYVPNYGLMGSLSGFVPLCVTAWGSDLLVDAARDPLRAARARFVLRRADLVLADSGNLAAAARDFGAPAARVRTIPWGVDLRRFAPAAVRESGLLVSTRMHKPVYDLPTLIRGVKPVLERRADARLVIAGDGPDRPALERLASRLLPAGRFRFIGSTSPAELAGWLSRAEIYLSASLSDSTSVSLLEAMASGLVPVVSDLEGNREWVEEGEGARLFRRGEAAGLTLALERALDDRGWAEAARARNRRVVEERGDQAVNLGRIEALFETLAAGRQAREAVGARP